MTAAETVEDNASTDTRESGSDDDADANAHADSFEKFVNSMSWEAHAEALAATLVVPANSSKVKYPILTHPAELLGDDGQQQQLCLFSLFSPWFSTIISSIFFFNLMFFPWFSTIN